MIGRRICTAVAAALVAISIAKSAHGAPEQAACPAGELTNQRLASEICLDRIPVPMVRPGRETVSVPAEVEQPIEVEYVQTPGLNPGEQRTVRVAGPRFLPDAEEESRIRKVMTEMPAEGWDRLVYQAAAWLGMGGERDETPQMAETHAEQPVFDMADSSPMSSAN